MRRISYAFDKHQVCVRRGQPGGFRPFVFGRVAPFTGGRNGGKFDYGGSRAWAFTFEDLHLTAPDQELAPVFLDVRRILLYAFFVCFGLVHLDLRDDMSGLPNFPVSDEIFRMALCVTPS